MTIKINIKTQVSATVLKVIVIVIVMVMVVMEIVIVIATALATVLATALTITLTQLVPTHLISIHLPQKTRMNIQTFKLFMHNSNHLTMRNSNMENQQSHIHIQATKNKVIIIMKAIL